MTIAIFGANSEIGAEIATLMAPGNNIVLAGRRMDDLERQAVNLRHRGAREVHCVFFDATETSTHSRVIDVIEQEGTTIDVAFAMFGVLGNQQEAERSGEEVHRILHTDFTAQAVLLTELTHRMKQRGRGTVVAFSSIAGARVRRPNYVYGSAKCGLDGFCQGMQDALVGTGVRLLVIRPGFVIGRMTQGMDPAPLSSTPARVARATVDALANPHATNIWVPAQLKVLAAVMQLVPRWLWRRAPR
ncbi:SDR family NAD(P)-dependent oxidoreductase [Corynebacterium anserum]|uniref:SDR family NAD(P)-dependent oxidoreductase n=1 Tax=Corynebacterium anserum TaxID=2684406 RepID=A0A7G7YR04_9CORY|nr:SDR family NAD(P)-dependent oxidoreductase [Corynebacterium anserum]QNH96924.1 SDR family NAD(P)-dependent oxidoreductase [Corynebacterium anserum]